MEVMGKLGKAGHNVKVLDFILNEVPRGLQIGEGGPLKTSHFLCLSSCFSFILYHPASYLSQNCERITP